MGKASSTKKKSAPKKASAKKVTRKPAKKAAKKSTRSRAPRVGTKAPEMVDYTITQEDLDTNPEFLKQGLKVGDVIQIPKTGAFHMEVTFNDATHETDTDDIAGAMLSLKPQMLKTKVIIRVTFKKKTAEFVLFNIKAKRIFTLPLAAQGFEKSVKTALNAF